MTPTSFIGLKYSSLHYLCLIPDENPIYSELDVTPFKSQTSYI